MSTIKLDILNTTAGETRTLHGDDVRLDGHMSDEDALYWWTDGNGGCGCNRQLMFERNSDADADAKCFDGVYLIRLTIDGEIVHDELSS